jgi:hypothetical protein
MAYTNSSHKQVQRNQDTTIEDIAVDLLNQNNNQANTNANATQQPAAKSPTAPLYNSSNDAIKEKFGELFYEHATGKERLITIDTDNYQAVISNKGGSIVR